MFKLSVHVEFIVEVKNHQNSLSNEWDEVYDAYRRYMNF